VPTVDELHKLTEYPERRIKPIVYAMASGGFRLGAWDYLRWKHDTPMTNGSTTGEEEDVVAAKLLVYFIIFSTSAIGDGGKTFSLLSNLELLMISYS